MQRLSPHSPLALAMVAFCVASAPARADEIEVSTSVDAVTVHLDGAMVERVGALSLPPGDSIVVIRNISPKLIDKTLRAQGAGWAADGADGVSIGAVSVRKSKENAQRSVNTAVIEALLAEQKELNDKAAAAEAQKRSVNLFLGESPGLFPRRSGLPSRTPEPPEIKMPISADLPAIWKAIAPTLEEAAAKLRGYAKRNDEINLEIVKLREASQNDGLAEDSYDAFIEMSANQAARGEIQLRYQVTGARWKPVYDLRLDSKARKISVTRRAEVGQRVGENWSDIKLSLSPTKSVTGLEATKLSKQMASTNRDMADLPSGRSPPALLLAGAPEAPKSFAEQRAAIDIGRYDARYDIEGRVHVPFTGVAKTFRIAESVMPADVFVKAVPRDDEGAFVQARFTNMDATPFLAGDAQLYRDGAFVGRGEIAFTQIKAEAELGFGADQSVTARRHVTRDVVLQKNKFGRSGKEIAFEIDVANHHDFALDILVEDRRPISADPLVKIMEAANVTPPTLRYDGERQGVVGWRWSYRPGETRTIRYGYRANFPAAKANWIYGLD